MSRPKEFFPPAWFGPFQNFNRARQSFLGDSESMAHESKLGVGLGFAFRPEKAVGGPYSNFLGRELLCVSERKIRRHNRETHAALPQKMRHHLFKWRCLLLSPLHFAFDLAEGNDLVHFRLLARPIDLEVAQNDGPLAVLLEKNK